MARLEDIIRFAVDMEIKAAKRYQHLYDLAEDPETKETLMRMKTMEENHRRHLESLNINEFINSGESAVTDLHIADNIPVKENLTKLSPRDILVLAAGYEDDARDLYLSLADLAARGSSARTLLLKLAEEESHHKFAVETELQNRFPVTD